MLVYDITNEKSFDNIKNWIRNIEEVSVSMPALSAFNNILQIVCNVFIVCIIRRFFILA